METRHLIHLHPPPGHGGGSSRSLLAVLGVWPRRLLHRGKSECCCHPHRPIAFAGHKSAPRPGSSGRGKMECDGLVLTNSGGAPSPHLASHHSPHTAESSPPPHSIWSSRIEPPTPPTAFYEFSSCFLLFHFVGAALSWTLV